MSFSKINYAYDIEKGELVTPKIKTIKNDFSLVKKKKKKKIDKLLELKNQIKKPNIMFIQDNIQLCRVSLLNFIIEIRNRNYPTNITAEDKNKIDELDRLYLSGLVIIKFLVDNNNLSETYLFEEIDFLQKIKSLISSKVIYLNELFDNIEYYIKKYFGIEKK